MEAGGNSDGVDEPDGPSASEDADAEWSRRLERLRRWLEIARDESVAPPLHYDVDTLCAHLKCSPPSRRRLGEVFGEAGRSFIPTTFSPGGFRTDAPYTAVLSLMKDAAGDGG